MRPDVPIIMITAYGDAETKRKARQRTQLINALRAHLAELGIAAAQGREGIKELLAIVAQDGGFILKRASKSRSGGPWSGPPRSQRLSQIRSRADWAMLMFILMSLRPCERRHRFPPSP